MDCLRGRHFTLHLLQARDASQTLPGGPHDTLKVRCFEYRKKKQVKRVKVIHQPEMPTFHVEAGENYILATPSWPTVGAKRWALDTL